MPGRFAPTEPQTASFWAGIRWGRFTFWLCAGAVAMFVVILAWHRTEEFLIKDDRFRIAEAPELPGTSPNLTVEGVHYASPSQIRHVFAEDFGRSLYLVPLQTRRRELMGIDWVEDASVSKVWPNALKVGIRERTPVAFVHLPPNRRDGTSQFALIDREGAILRPRIPARFTLPVITGLKEEDAVEERRVRVRSVLALLRAVGPLAGQISEIDASDLNDLIVAEHVDGAVVNLMLGDGKYAERLQNFLANYAEIKAKRPGTKVLDLRVDGVITAVGEDTHGQS